MQVEITQYIFDSDDKELLIPKGIIAELKILDISGESIPAINYLGRDIVLCDDEFKTVNRAWRIKRILTDKYMQYYPIKFRGGVTKWFKKFMSMFTRIR